SIGLFEDAVWNGLDVKHVAMDYKVQSPRLAARVDAVKASLYFAPKANWVCVGKQWQHSKVGNAVAAAKELYRYDDLSQSGRWPRLTSVERWSLPLKGTGPETQM